MITFESLFFKKIPKTFKFLLLPLLDLIIFIFFTEDYTTLITWLTK